MNRNVSNQLLKQLDNNSSRVKSSSNGVLPNLPCGIPINQESFGFVPNSEQLKELVKEPGLISKIQSNLLDVICQLRKIDIDLDLVYGNIFIDPNSPVPDSNVCDKQEALSLDKIILNDFDTINMYLKYISETISKLNSSL